MAWKIIETNGSYNTSGGVNTLLVTICCDDIGDLPSASQTGYNIGMGSVANIISNGDTYKMKSNGTWVLQPSGEFRNVYTKAEVDTIIAGVNDDIQDVQDDLDTFLATAPALKFTPETSSPSVTNGQRVRLSAANSNNILEFLVGKLNSTTNYIQFYINGVDKGYITFDVSRNVDVWQ